MPTSVIKLSPFLVSFVVNFNEVRAIMEIFALFEKNVIWEPVTFFDELVGEYEFSDSFEWAENHAKTGKLQAQLSQDSFYWVVLEWVFLGLVILASVAVVAYC